MLLARVVCEEPEILKIMIVIKNIMTLMQVVVPVGLILFMSQDVLRAVTGGNQDDIKKKVAIIPKRLILAGVVYFVPLLVNMTAEVVDDNFEFASCFSNANTEYISEAYKSKAEGLLIKAEEMVEDSFVSEAITAINKIADDTLRKAMLERAAAVASQVDEKNSNYLLSHATGPILTLREGAYDSPDDSQDVVLGGNGSVGGTGTADFEGFYTDGNATTSGSGSNTSEPDPSAAINYWIKNSDLYNEGDFIYPKAPNGKSLGAWPKDYASIPTQLTGFTTHNGGAFIFPNTPYKSELKSNEGIYNFVYEHNGIDIIAPIGIPVYSPVNGTLVYSEWGHTKNKGKKETSYTVSINMSATSNVGGKEVGAVFMTHLSGIINRCASGECNKTIKQGELIGFVGWANAGHLHMTIHPKGNYNGGLTTSSIDKMYGIPAKTNSYKIKAGG